MWDWMFMDQWSPYAVGIGMGVLCWLTFIFSCQPVSCSTAVSQTSGMIEKLFRGNRVGDKDYYKRFPPVINWRWMFLLGVLIGACLSSVLAGSFEVRWVPQLWESRFGPAVLPRLIIAFVGGVFMGFGSRWVNGCTSGHGISGTLQLVVSSWVSVIFFFIGGIGCALLIYQGG